jgi:hypothetical protein
MPPVTAGTGWMMVPHERNIGPRRAMPSYRCLFYGPSNRLIRAELVDLPDDRSACERARYLLDRWPGAYEVIEFWEA